jgi:hypothetical protein
MQYKSELPDLINQDLDVSANVIEIKSRYNHKDASANAYLRELSDFFLNHLERSLNEIYKQVRKQSTIEAMKLIRQRGKKLLHTYKQHMLAYNFEGFIKDYHGDMNSYLARYDKRMADTLEIICGLLKRRHYQEGKRSSRIALVIWMSLIGIMSGAGIIWLFSS